jgi:hypothetical protein
MDTPERAAAEPAAPPERLVVGPRLRALLADAMFAAPAVPALLDAFLEGAGADPDRRWRLVLTGAEVVADDAAPTAAPGGGAG